jgi:very-short-patch-repair endonuclease
VSSSLQAARAILAEHAGEQLGLFTRRQAREAGFKSSAIDFRVSSGEWEIVDEGTYRVFGTRGSWSQRLLAACLAGDAVASHPPERQWIVSDHRRQFIGRVDFAYPDHGVGIELLGAAFHASDDAWRRDITRLTRLEATGLHVLQFTWEDVHQRPEYVVATVRALLALRDASLTPE